MQDIETDYDRVLYLKQILMKRATGGNNEDEKNFMELRRYILDNKNLKDKAPKWLKNYRSLDEFWEYIKNSKNGYAARRNFLTNEFEILLNYLEFNEEELITMEENIIQEEVVKVINKKIFIVHGHDESMKETVARYIEKLGLEAIILHEKANNGKTIIEKIEENTDVGCGIVLYSPCDEGKAKNSTELKSRARQNVVFEHGFLIGKLGRENVMALNKENVEVPSDISGIVYIKFDENSGWKMNIIQELVSKGYEIDTKKIFGM